LFSAMLTGCGEQAAQKPPAPPPTIDLGSSSEPETPAANTEPEAKNGDGAKATDAKPAQVFSPAEQRISAILDDPTELAFNDTPLSDVIVYLADLHNIQIIIDNQDLSDAAIPTDSPVTRTLAGVKLRSALKIVLEPLKLSYVIEDDVLKIVT